MEGVLSGKAHYLGAGRSKSDIESYRTALEAWKKLKVQLDAELIPILRAYDFDYDEVIREWELVLAWSVQHVANDEVRTLLSGTNRLLRLCILLGLNCRMTQKDISDLLDRDVDWKEGRITRKRSKTSSHEGVLVVCYKLWPETLKLLRELSSGTEAVLLTPKGSRLLQQHLNQNGSLNKSDSIKPLYLRECEQLSSKKPFKLLRKTSATLINSNPQSRGLDQHFPGHSPSLIADKHYVATAKSALDEALE